MSDGADDAQHNLQYVCDMLEQLKLVTGVQRRPLLAYLIDVARLEASNELGQRPGHGLAEKRDAAV